LIEIRIVFNLFLVSFFPKRSAARRVATFISELRVSGKARNNSNSFFDNSSQRYFNQR
jgi:hypothetical protein